MRKSKSVRRLGKLRQTIKLKMKFFPKLLLALLACNQAVHAASVTLYNTGVDSAGSQLPGGAIDPHWQIVSGPGISSPVPAVVVSNQNSGLINWYIQTLDSRWIWADQSGVAIFDAPYTFQFVFDLTGIDPATVSLSGLWGVDNIGFIRLNGSTTGIGTGILSLPDVIEENYQSLYSFKLDSGFLPTINTLEFVSTDSGGIGGLNISGLTMTVDVPEPTALLAQSVVAAWAVSPIWRRSRRPLKVR
jgi:hypothetical protein